MSTRYPGIRLEASLRDAGIPTVSVADRGVGAAQRFRIDLRPDATAAQRDQAAAITAAFNPDDDAAQAAWEEDQNPERKSVREAASQFLADTETYLALSSPTNAQVVAQVGRLSRAVRGLVRRVIQLD